MWLDVIPYPSGRPMSNKCQSLRVISSQYIYFGTAIVITYHHDIEKDVQGTALEESQQFFLRGWKDDLSYLPRHEYILVRIEHV
jgi:hypothetical protein